jgi:hypothetical protein
MSCPDSRWYVHGTGAFGQQQKVALTWEITDNIFRIAYRRVRRQLLIRQVVQVLATDAERH